MKTKITILVMLFVTAMSFAQKKWEPYHQFSFDAGYTFSSLKENQNPNRLLFAGDGVNFGIGHRWGDTWGIASRIGFSTGTIDEDGIRSITAKLPIPPIYIPNPRDKNWSQISVMTGPSIKLGKKHQFELNAMAGIGINPSPNNIRIDAYEQQDIFIETVYEAKDKSIVGLWQVDAKMRAFFIPKLGSFHFTAGYGSNGATLGIATVICIGAPCFKCPYPGCVGEMPKKDVK